MISNEYLEIQAQLLNSAVKKITSKLSDDKLYYKLAFLICCNNSEIKSQLNNIETVYNRINKCILEYKFKQAMRYACMLNKLVDNICTNVFDINSDI